MSVEPEELAPEAGEEGKTEVEVLQKELAKARKEAARYRVESRNAKIPSEFGEAVSEFVPKDLPIEEAREYAQRLKETFESSATEAQESAGQAAPPEEAASPLAAVSQPSTGTSVQGKMSYADWKNVYDTQGAQAAFAIPMNQVDLDENPLPMHVGGM